jgi:hypothetical protein
MGQWQNKILFTLILYGAGFITAVYLLAPCPLQASDQTLTGETIPWSQHSQSMNTNAAMSSPAWALKVRAGIETCIHFAEEYALQAADLIRSKMGQGKDHSSE